jgi:Xaa-Pro aminopeptidase
MIRWFLLTLGKYLSQANNQANNSSAHYLGYSSDVCRSFFINPPKSRLDHLLSFFGSKRSTSNEGLYAEKLRVWDIVLEAQTEAGKMFKPGNTAASVDIAARDVIDRAGYEGKFTHRLGHGIGIKGTYTLTCRLSITAPDTTSAHESPYLNNGNHQAILQSGMTFTNEPGIYLEGRFGVRHEDIYLVKADGEAEVLSGSRAISAYEP